MKRWDVVIVGTNAGGILAGALLVKKGFSVLFLEEKAQAGNTRWKYRFPRFSNLSEIFLRSAVVEEVHNLLGLPMAGREFARKGDITCQILLPGHRVDILSVGNDPLEEMKKAFPRELGLIESFYSRLRGEDWIGRMVMSMGNEQPLSNRIGKGFARAYHSLSDKPLSGIVGILGGDNAFARFIDVQIKSMSYLYVDDFPLSLATHLIGTLFRDDVITDATSRRGFLERLRGETVKWGGRTSLVESLDSIRIEQSTGEFRIYKNGEDTPILSRFCIANLPLTRLKNLVNTDFSGKKWVERGRGLWPKYFVFSLNFGLEAREIPVGLGDCFVSLRDMDAPYENGNLLMGFMRPEGVGAPANKRAVSVNALIPVSKEKRDRAEIRGVIENMLVHLLEVAPFLDRSIRLIDGRPSLKRYGGQWTTSDIVYGGNPSFRVGTQILPISTPLEGLFLPCRENFPYLGFEGDILSGIRTARAILRRAR
jgi:hypothetical protein